MSGDTGALRAEFLAKSEGLTPACAKPTIKKLNFSHEAIIQWLLENPGKLDGGKMAACAEHFGYTRSWLSIIVHSDAFQAKWREMQNEADALIIADIPAKLRGVASVAVEALAEQVELAAMDKTPAPRDFLLKSSEMLLKSLGYGAGSTKIAVSAPGGNVQVNAVDPATLSRARERLIAPRANEKEVPALSGPETPTT